MDIRLLVLALLGPILMVALAIVAQAAGAGKIPRGHFIGIRIRSTLASDDAWRAGHRAAVLPAYICAVALVVVDIAAALVAASTNSPRLTALGLIPFILLSIAWIFVAANRAAKSVQQELA